MFSMQGVRGLFHAVALTALLSAPAVSRGQSARVGGTWRQKTVSIEVVEAKPQALIARLADQIGQSLLVEGMPLNKRVSL